MGTDRHTVRTSWEEKGKNCGEAAEEAKEHQCATESPGARRQVWKRYSFTALRRNKPCHHLDLGLFVPRTVRQPIYAVCHSVHVPLLQQSWQTNTQGKTSTLVGNNLCWLKNILLFKDCISLL